MKTTIPTKRKFSNICTVALYVGSERTKFDVHQDQLCEVSSFFKAAFTSQFKESSEKAIDLLDDDLDTVDLFVQWLYKRQCDPFAVPADDNGDYLMQPMRLLVFADTYDIPTLKQYMFTKLVAHFHDYGSRAPSEAVAVYVYNSTSSGSGIRRLIADWMANFLGQKLFRISCNREWLLLQPEIAVDLLAAFCAISGKNRVPEQLKRKRSERYMNYYMGTNTEHSED